MDYFPGNPPKDPAQLPVFLREEFRRMQLAFGAPQKFVRLQKLHAQPVKFGEGDVVFADGTDWKPNGTGGKGVWYFNGTAWVNLG